MNKEQRMRRIAELLDKDDFNSDDYDELKALIAENDREYYRLKEKYKEDHDDKVKMANKDNGSYWRGRADEAYDMISLMDSDFMEFLSSLRE